MSRTRVLRIEADAVVPNLKTDLGIVLSQRDPNVLRPPMAAGIVQSLLGNPV
jgi:hypothetical protein